MNLQPCQELHPYWMVHCPTQGPAHARHDTFESAEQEAARLARDNPGHTFYVLQTMVARFVRDPVERVEFDPAVAMIPF